MSVLVAALLAVTVLSLGLAAFGERAARREQRRLRHLGTHDGLTAVANRSALEQALDELLSAKRSAGRAAVILIELDHFDTVNETSGHEVGDHLLIAASDRLREALAPTERLFRLSGPQFVVLAPQAITREAAEARADAMQQSVRVQYRIDHDHLKISASAAVVMLDQRHTDAGIVIDDAIAGIRHAASLGPGTRVVFELSMQPTMSEESLTERLRQANANGEFLLMYLPVVDLRDSSVVGVEALLRWADPERGLVVPGDFLEALDHAGILDEVGEWSMRQAFLDNRRWHERYPDRDVVTTVNVSAGQIAALTFPSLLHRVLEETGAEPSRLCLEMTGVPDPHTIDLIWRNLRLVKEEGLQVALDDFGVGFATFDFVRRFTLDVIKIDRSLVERVADSDADAAIIQQLVHMAHELGLLTIAEGVDQSEQAAALSGLGCELAQGYYWSQPVPLDSAEKLIARRAIRPSANRAKRIDWKAPGSGAPSGAGARPA